jgi:hypothetical protein
MSEQTTISDRLSPADLSRLMACRKRLTRAEAEYKAALAEHAVVMLDLEPYALGPGDKIDPTTGEITRAQTEPPTSVGAPLWRELPA